MRFQCSQSVSANQFFLFYLQQMEPAKQTKMIKEFQKQSAQMDMTVICCLDLRFAMYLIFLVGSWLCICYFFEQTLQCAMDYKQCQKYFSTFMVNLHIWLIGNIIWPSFQIEMMSEAIDETLDKDEAEEETEELTNQVHSTTPLDSSIVYCFCQCQNVIF